MKDLHAVPPRLQRMLLRLQNYNVTIQYQTGKSLALADGLSRLPIVNPSPAIDLDTQVSLIIQFSQERGQQLREETDHGRVLAPLRDLIVAGWPNTEVTTQTTTYWSYRDELSVEEGGDILKGSQ